MIRRRESTKQKCIAMYLDSFKCFQCATLALAIATEQIFNKPQSAHSYGERPTAGLSNKINHRADWYNPQFPIIYASANDNFDAMLKRRPLFYPIYPYYPFYLHSNPSTNDAEFETIEAQKNLNYESESQNIPEADGESHQRSYIQPIYGPPHHRPHHPHFPLNPGNSGEDSMGMQFHHGPSHPHFNTFHKNPATPESKVANIFDYQNINDDEFPTLDEAQPYRIPTLSGNRKFFHFYHHGHGKPHQKPTEIDENDLEGSGEEEIVPFIGGSRAPLVQDDNIEEEEITDLN